MIIYNERRFILDLNPLPGSYRSLEHNEPQVHTWRSSGEAGGGIHYAQGHSYIHDIIPFQCHIYSVFQTISK